MFVDYYEVLDIPINALENEIKEAFRKQAINWHPDKNPEKDTTTRMQLINEAYLILKDNEAREKYDIEYYKFKIFSEAKEKAFSGEPEFTDSEYTVQDDILSKWMRNARRQAIILAKQTIIDFKDIGAVGAKAAAKKSGTQFIAHIVITIIAIIVFSIIGKCN